MNKTVTIVLDENYQEMLEDLIKKYAKEGLELNTSSMIRICIRKHFFQQKDS